VLGIPSLISSLDVLILGQIAAAAGATVIATSSSDSKLEVAKKLGASHTINYTAHPDWEKEVLRITNGRGVDRVVEVGGSATLLQSLKATRMGGLVVVIGVLTDGDEKGVAAEILFGAKTVRGHLGESADVLKRLAKFVQAHEIRPVVGKIFAFEDSLKAFQLLQEQKAVGKIVITL
jgi:NADPH:quinone reductase-like Zn-dependent oxidoreductase